jgi:molybdenum cofactor synthesis domain-containing protein
LIPLQRNLPSRRTNKEKKMNRPPSDLLEKTELWIKRISLQEANLNDFAAVVAETLGMGQSEVLVTDVQDEHVTVDILRQHVDAHEIVGKRDLLLQSLAKLPGVHITEETSIHSNGMLGWIAFDRAEAEEALARSEKMVEEIRLNLSKRAIVFSTGHEVATGQIQDTNTPSIAEMLQAEGYVVQRGPTLKDDKILIAGNLRQAVYDDGYALILTTGGVGAEDKDHTVEAVLYLDPDAVTPYICKFEIGTGRHAKDGVRIAVGQVEDSLIVALPGPNDEVKISMEVLVQALKSCPDKHALAEEIASKLRHKLSEKMKHWAHGHAHIFPRDR